MTTPTFQFVDELPSSNPGRKSRYLPVAEEMRRHPGQWALILEDVAQSTGSQIRKTGYGAFVPVSEWEIATRKVDGHYNVYARYLGKDSAHADLVPEIPATVPDDAEE